MVNTKHRKLQTLQTNYRIYWTLLNANEWLLTVTTFRNSLHYTNYCYTVLPLSSHGAFTKYSVFYSHVRRIMATWLWSFLLVFFCVCVIFWTTICQSKCENFGRWSCQASSCQLSNSWQLCLSQCQVAFWCARWNGTHQINFINKCILKTALQTSQIASVYCNCMYKYNVNVTCTTNKRQLNFC